MRNPLTRKRRDPVEQALDALEDIRAEASNRAAGLRDAAGQAVELLGEAAPEARRLRVPIVAGVLAAAVGTAIAIATRRRRRVEPPTAESPVPTAATTAAKATAAPAAPERSAPTPAAAVEAEKPKEPKATTDESEAAAKEAKQ